MNKRVVTVLLACAFAAFAGEARAQLDECIAPSDVPAKLTTDMVLSFGGIFGTLETSMCVKLVAGAVKSCQAAARRAVPCHVSWQRGMYKARVLLCNRFEDPERRDCRDAVKADFQSETADVKDDRDLALLDCDGTFKGNLLEACLEGTP
jgi:hypothetical protein